MKKIAGPFSSVLDTAGKNSFLNRLNCKEVCLFHPPKLRYIKICTSAPPPQSRRSTDSSLCMRHRVEVAHHLLIHGQELLVSTISLLTLSYTMVLCVPTESPKHPVILPWFVLRPQRGCSGNRAIRISRACVGIPKCTTEAVITMVKSTLGSLQEQSCKEASLEVWRSRLVSQFIFTCFMLIYVCA